MRTASTIKTIFAGSAECLDLCPLHVSFLLVGTHITVGEIVEEDMIVDTSGEIFESVLNEYEEGIAELL